MQIHSGRSAGTLFRLQSRACNVNTKMRVCKHEMALQDSTVILSVRCDGNLDVHEGYIEHRASVIICIHLAAHAIWCGTTSSADRVP
ncbi:hypothetical protein T05_7673 [Trichinella murrelli]|uniref:Uncharacterized protein n=2 Tax=Trichinella TaxID=6333 RepID=A0A0V0T6C9_9BILA|nr:hypothetical protein T05_7673 [Trichinella murrelli]